MILLKLFFVCYPALVVGHGYMMTPMARTGDDRGAGLRSPKLSPWMGYKAEIDMDESGCYGPVGLQTGNNKNAEQYLRGANPVQGLVNNIMTIGTPFMVQWDIRLGHAGSKNHVRIAYRKYSGLMTQTQFEGGVLFNMEDTDADRAAERSPVFTSYLTTGIHTEMITLPNTATPGMAELQWVWASERDGAGGYYISCADVQIVAANTVPVTMAPSMMSQMVPTPAPDMTGMFQCYDGADASRVAKYCAAPLNDRCMTTWVNNKYYYRCSNRDYCISAKQSAVNEGMSNGVQFQSGLTALECCDTSLCNQKNIVDIPAEWASSFKPIATMGFFIGLAHLLL